MGEKTEKLSRLIILGMLLFQVFVKISSLSRKISKKMIRSMASHMPIVPISFWQSSPLHLHRLRLALLHEIVLLSLLRPLPMLLLISMRGSIYSIKTINKYGSLTMSDELMGKKNLYTSMQTKTVMMTSYIVWIIVFI